MLQYVKTIKIHRLLARFIEVFLIFSSFLLLLHSSHCHKNVDSEQCFPFKKIMNLIKKSQNLSKTFFSFLKLSKKHTKSRQLYDRKTSGRSISSRLVPMRKHCFDQLMYLIARPDMPATRSWTLRTRSWSSLPTARSKCWGDLSTCKNLRNPDYICSRRHKHLRSQPKRYESDARQMWTRQWITKRQQVESWGRVAMPRLSMWEGLRWICRIASNYGKCLRVSNKEIDYLSRNNCDETWAALTSFDPHVYGYVPRNHDRYQRARQLDVQRLCHLIPENIRCNVAVDTRDEERCWRHERDEVMAASIYQSVSVRYQEACMVWY